MYSLQPNSQDLISCILPIQQGVAVPLLWRGGDLPSLNILTKGSGRRLTLLLDSPVIRFPVCFSAAYLSCCIVVLKLLLVEGEINPSQGLLLSSHNAAVQMTGNLIVWQHLIKRP